MLHIVIAVFVAGGRPAPTGAITWVMETLVSVGKGAIMRDGSVNSRKLPSLRIRLISEKPTPSTQTIKWRRPIAGSRFA
ncbi:MAG: hypothetical protein WKF30_07520 [Pyrinomonadaceae bacterium]